MDHGLPERITLAGAHSFKMEVLFMYVVTANPELNENTAIIELSKLIRC